MKQQKIKSKLNKLPVVTKLDKVENDRYKDFPLAHYSYSTFSKFSTNPFMFLVNYKQKVYFDSAQGVAGVLGKAVHSGLEAYQGGSDLFPVSNEEEGIVAGLKTIEEYLVGHLETVLNQKGEEVEEMVGGIPDGFIKYTTTIKDKAKLLEKAIFAFNAYVSEIGWREKTEELIALEDEMIEDIDLTWKGKKIALPIKLKGFTDKLIRHKKGLSPIDYKIVSKFSPEDKLDGAKMIQAVMYFLLTFAKYGEAPYSMRYQEIKHSLNSGKNKGMPQVKEYEMVYEDHQLMFDFFFRFYDDITMSLNEGRAVYVPNINDMFDADISIIAYTHRLDNEEDVAKQMIEEQVDTITELLKRKLEKKQSMGEIIKKIQERFADAKSINYEKMKTHEAIKHKLLTLGVAVNYIETHNGATVDRHLFKIGVANKLKHLISNAEDISLALGVDSVSVGKQVGMIETIFVDVPVKERKFFEKLPKLDKNNLFNISIGVDALNNKIRKDIREAPHMLVAGATGAGKSVFIESIIQQLMKIDNTEFVLIDPKGTEMIHHKSSDKVINYFDDVWDTYVNFERQIAEMNRRFEILAKQKVRNIKDLKGVDMNYRFIFFDEFADFIVQNFIYNIDIHYVDYIDNTGAKMLKNRVESNILNSFITNIESEGGSVLKVETKSEKTNVSKEISRQVQMLVQKGRAVGIHMILATQRPSVKVITGDIKANFPVKVAFRVAKEVDSKVLLDVLGAEKLLGKGDMLYSDNDGIIRLQGYNV